MIEISQEFDCTLDYALRRLSAVNTSRLSISDSEDEAIPAV